MTIPADNNLAKAENRFSSQFQRLCLAAITGLCCTSLPVDIAEAAVIPNGGSVDGTLSAPDEIDTHTFEGTAGQMGLISVSGNLVGGEFFRVFNPDGSPLRTGTGPVMVALEQTGTYSVNVQSFSSGQTGDYTVHLALALGANEHGAIPNGASASEAIDDGGEIDSFVFGGTAGQGGLVSISGDLPGGAFFYVFNPDGTPLTSGVSPRLVSLEQTGTYTVVVQSFTSGETGNYTVYLALALGADEHGEIANGGAAVEAIDVGGEIDSFIFSGAAGQRGLVSISGDLPSGEFFYVFNPDGTTLTSGVGPRLVSLEQTGIYTVVVQSFGSGQTGNYTLHLALAPGANEHGAIPNGGISAEAIDDGGEIDSFTFSGGVGATGQIAIEGDLPSGEFMYIFNPDGSVFGSTSSQLDLALAQGGVYTVVVQSFSSGQTGPYVISLNVSDVAENRRPIASPQALTTIEDVALPVVLSAQDPDGDALTFRITGDPAMGVLTGTPPSVTYAPNGGFVGSDQFFFVANDGILDSTTATVSIQIQAALPADAGVPDVGSSSDVGSANDAAGAPEDAAVATDAGLMADTGAADSGQPNVSSGDDDSDGCGCRTSDPSRPSGSGPGVLFLLFGGVWAIRRRIRARNPEDR